MRHTFRHTLAAAAVVAIGLSGVVAPARADTAPDCDQAVLTAALATATTNAEVAKKAFTTYAKSSLRGQIRTLEAKEAREARQAAHKAAQLAKQAAKAHTPEARAEAKAARAEARAEAKEAARLLRASKAQKHAAVKAERARLRLVWHAARVELHQAVAQVKDCAAQNSDPEDTDPAT